MSMTRKRFLSLLSSAAALALAGPSRLLAAASPRVVGFRGENFKRMEGGTFSIRGPRGLVRLILQEVKPRPKDPSTDQFSLIFAGEGGVDLPEDTYPVTFPDQRELPLFIGPAGASGDGGSLFRADFNLLK
jgi:hypothetical protein